MLGKFSLLLLASYAAFIDRCRDFCDSHEEDSEAILLQYCLWFSIGTAVDIVFSWLLIFFGVHESSPTNTERECQIHDHKLTQNDNVAYVIISNIIDMLVLGIYGVVVLINVSTTCSQAPIRDGFCHTTTWILTVCSLLWAICVAFLYYKNIKQLPSDGVQRADYTQTGLVEDTGY